MRLWVRTLAALSGGALLLGLAGPAASAAPASPVRTSSVRSAQTQTSAHRTPPQRPITRLVVKTRDGSPASTRIRGAAATLAGLPAVSSVGTRTGGKTLLSLGPGLSVEDAWKVAHALTARADVVYAEPDLRVYPTVDPVVPNDPLFNEQVDVFASCCLSTDAAVAWSRTRGRPDVVVAVLDTGLTVHPDITSSVVRPLSTDPIVKGYDFVSLDDASMTSTPILRPWTANDGNGRDPDPSDPGDWISAADTKGTTANGWFQNCAFDPTGDPSSWHGTHVTGTIVARQNNRIGISGMAPGVKVQPVRVLGKCGGSASDIDDAITWASGGHVAGVPDNPTPATVISMSLGGSGACLPSTQEAIAGATSRGATVVVAAGNEGVATYSANPAKGSQPGNCPGVITVTASRSTADGALAPFSNFGPVPGSLVVAAPGDDILSTINAGLTVPKAGTYGRMSGTSMATPHVSALVALLQSLHGARGRLDQQQVRDTLTSMGTTTDACPAAKCGVGVVGFSTAGEFLPLYAPVAPTLRAQARTGSVDLTWIAGDDGGRATTFAVQQSTDGGAWGPTSPAHSGLTGTTASITGLSGAHSYEFRVVATNATGSSTSAVVGPETPSAYAVQAVTPVGRVERIDVTWSAPEAGDATGYQVRWRPLGGAGWSYLPAVVTGTAATLTTAPAAMDPGVYEVQVAAEHAGVGADPSSWEWSDSRTATVTALVQGFTASATLVRPYRDGYQDSVLFRVATNRTGGSSGTLRIYDAKMTLVRSVALGTGSSWSYAWTGLNSRNVRVPNGRYYAIAWIKGRSTRLDPVATSPTIVTRSVVVASSAATRPTITMTSASLFPARDGFRDSTVIRSAAGVPAAMTWKLVRAGKTWWSATFSRRMLATAVYAGARTGGGTLPSGTYVLYVYAKGGEGAQTVSYTYLTVSTKRLVAHPFRVNWTASTAFRGGLGSGSAKSGWYVTMPERSVGVFTGALPSSVAPLSHLALEVDSGGDLGTSPAHLIGGYFVGTTSNPETLRWDPVGKAVVVLPSPTTTAAQAGGLLRWYLYNAQTVPSSSWQVREFSVTGTYYTFG